MPLYYSYLAGIIGRKEHEDQELRQNSMKVTGTSQSTEATVLPILPISKLYKPYA
jgi:hypothetical protein